MLSAFAIRRTFCQLKTLKQTTVNLRLNTDSRGCSALPLTRGYATQNDEIEKTITDFKEGKFDKLPNPDPLAHFKKEVLEKPGLLKLEPGSPPPMGTHALPHPIWSDSELHDVKITHKPPDGFVERSAYLSVKLMRSAFDLISGFKWATRTEKKWLKIIIFLETLAGVPSMVAAITRYLHSLRRMQRDYGWIHTLLEEAENEGMHLMTALQLKQPSCLFRMGVVSAQVAFVTMFSISYLISYLISPRFCHRFVGYLEEEAVITYTDCLKDIETGCMTHWKTQPAPVVAKDYWKLEENATMKEVILAIRADEAHHRLVNHTLASIKKTDYNPYKPGK